MNDPRAVIAILGGTGKEGQGLALRFAARGRSVVLGSRDAEKGRRTAEELNRHLGSDRIAGTTNARAAADGAVILSTLPYSGHAETAAALKPSLAGKLVVTATLRWPPSLDGLASAAEELAKLLDGTARVAAAFQTVSAKTLRELEAEPEDVLVFADLPETRSETVALVDSIGFRGIEAGALANSRVAEALTGVLLGINKRYGVKSTGIRITGLPGRPTEP